MKQSKFAGFAWSLLVYTLAVILFGAYVRASGSGAGCGSHWPLCNGQVIPRSPQLETIIEYTHRVTSGISLPLTLVLFAWAFRKFPRGHRVRFGASLTLIFFIIEALVGAGLVKFEWVAQDASTGRVVAIAVHLVNTFLLIAFMTLTAYWGSGGQPIRIKGQGILLWALALGLIGVLVIGVTGAITALGDTLFPAGSLQEGLQQDFSSTVHFAVRLRIWHPILAISVGFYLAFVSSLITLFKSEPATRRFAIALWVLIFLQLGAGLLNVVLLVPIWMQIIHLLLADLVWISLILFSAYNLRGPEPVIEPLPAARARPVSGLQG